MEYLSARLIALKYLEAKSETFNSLNGFIERKTELVLLQLGLCHLEIDKRHLNGIISLRIFRLKVFKDILE
jgi:hypothetical protein